MGFSLTIHCSACDNIFHYSPLTKPVETKSTAVQLSSPQANLSHQPISSEVETLTTHFSSLVPSLYPSSSDYKNSIFSTFYLKYAYVQQGFSIMLNPTSLKILTPAFAVFGILFLMGFIAPTLFFDSLESLLPSSPHIPNSNIFIEETKIEQITTDNGKHVMLLSGTVRNDGLTSVKDVIIQGLLYDSHGSRLTDALGFADHVVGAEDAKSLSNGDLLRLARSAHAEDIKKDSTVKIQNMDFISFAQGQEEKRKKELEAGHAQDFTVIIPLTENMPPKNIFYSARIFTVS
jgi:hypothetical protein